MALSFAKVSDAVGVQGTIRETFYDVTFDASYPTGGEAIAPNEVGLGTIIHGAEVIGHRLTSGTPTTAYVVLWDYVSGKLQVFVTGTAADTVLNEVANATNLATRIFRIRFVGV